MNEYTYIARKDDDSVYTCNGMYENPQVFLLELVATFDMAQVFVKIAAVSKTSKTSCLLA